MTTPRRFHRRAISLTLLALCSAPAFAAEGSDPQRALDEYAKEVEAQRAGGNAAAQYYYARAMAAKQESRLDDAIKDLSTALDYQGDHAEARKQLAEVQALAGRNRDARSLQIDRMADEVQVRQTELWTEAQALKDDGTRQLAAGAYAEAERSFQLAQVRLENLPFADPRREGAMRELDTLLTESRNRRAQAEVEAAGQRSRVALQRSQELREAAMQIERDRLDAMLKRAQRARDRRDYDEAILICEQILRLNRAEERAAELLTRSRRERHVYLRSMTADRWDEEHKLLSESIRSAMLPQLELVTYTTEWPELDARRSAPVRGLQEQQEAWRKELANQLEQEITVDFQDTDLQDVVAFLQKITNANIVLDSKVIAAGTPPVSLKVERMKLKFVLEFITKNVNLNYVLRDEAIYISNSAGLAGSKFMKLYDIRDLTHEMASFPGPKLEIPEPGGTGSRLLPPIEGEVKVESAEFQDIVKRVVAPSSWDGEGAGTIGDWNGALVVTHNADVHAQVEKLLRELRNQRGTQIHVKCKFLEVENTMLEEIGVNWQNYGTYAVGASPSSVNGQSPVAAGSNYGMFYGDRHTNNVTAARINNGLLSYTTGTGMNPTGGLNWQTQSWQVGNQFFASAILNAVEKEKRGNVLQEPDLTLFNGQQAHLVNMRQTSYIGDYNVENGQYDPIMSILSYGTVMDVKAVASADKKYVTLTIRPTNSSIFQWRRFGGAVVQTNRDGTDGSNQFGNGSVTGAGAAIAGTNPLLMPELIFRTVQTTVTVPDGGSIVIAGMTNGISNRAHSGVPFLSHIPFLGRLFSTNGRAEQERRLMITLQADLILFDEIEKKL